MPRTSLKVLALVILAAAVVHAQVFKSVWKAPDAGPMNYFGKKIAAVVITDDQGLQMSAEEALAKELTARGVQGVAAYRILPREEAKDAEKVKGWFERSKIEGAVVMRVVSMERDVTYRPGMWQNVYYQSLWGFYNYGYAAVYVPGGRSEQSNVTVETLIFDVPTAKLLWAGVSDTTNPKGAQRVVAELVTAVGEQLRQAGLVIRR
jgi:hypothetical protein